KAKRKERARSHHLNCDAQRRCAPFMIPNMSVHDAPLRVFTMSDMRTRRLHRASDLALTKTMTHQHHWLPRWPACGAALAAAPGPHLLTGRNFFRPFLDGYR